MKIIFMGTPDFAKQILKALVDSRHEVKAVVTQPDKPKGRGYELIPQPIKVFAEAKGIAVYQPVTLKNGELQPIIDKYQPDVIVVAAYGKILPPYVIHFGGYGCINVHGSILPKYRGAAPIQRAIIDGEEKTGVTIMQMDDGLDTGDMLLTSELTIGEDDNFETIHDKLAVQGAKALLETLDKLEEGTIIPIKQDDSLASYAGKIEKSDCLLDFSHSAKELSNRIRGLSPTPLAYTFLKGKMLKITSARAIDENSQEQIGTVISIRGGEIKIACKEGILCVNGVLPEGKGRMKAADFINGRGVNVGDVFSNER